MLKLIKYSFFIFIFIGLSIPVLAQNQTARDYFEEGLHLSKEKKYEQALEAFRESAKLEPKQPATHANIGHTLLTLKRGKEAVAAYREAVRLLPDNAEFHAGLCRALSYDQQLTEALAECQKAIRLDENSLQANTNLILVYQMENRSPREILSLVEEALQKFPDDLNLLRVAAALYAQIGDNSRAAQLYEKFVQINPDDISSLVQLADIYLRLERDADAISAAQKAIAIDPENVMAHYFLGKVYFELGQNEEAANAFQKVTEFGVNLPDAFYFLAVSQSRRGSSEEAIAAFRKAIELDPKNFNFNKDLGQLLTTSGRHEEAIIVLRKAISLNPNSFETKVGLGLALFESAQHEEGLKILMEADRMRPGDQIVNMFLSVARARQQGLAELEQKRIYARKNPHDLNVKMQLMQTLGYAGRLDEAEPYIQEILKMNPKDIRVYQSIGVVYSSAHKYEKATRMFKKSLEIEENPGAYLNLAAIYTKNGEINEAIEAYEKVLELKSDAPNIMKVYADLLRDNGKKREALAMYKRSLALLPTNPPAVFNAGMLSLKFGEIDNARQYLELLKTIDPDSAKTLARCIKLNQ